MCLLIPIQHIRVINPHSSKWKCCHGAAPLLFPNTETLPCIEVQSRTINPGMEVGNLST